MIRNVELKVSRHTYSIVLIFIMFVLTACGADDVENVPSDVTPSESTAEVVATAIPAQSVVSLQIDEVRLTEKASHMTYEIQRVSMVPFDSEGNVWDARFDYFDADDDILLTAGNPYRPDTVFSLSATRQDLEQQDFGIWFLVQGRDPSNDYSNDDINALFGDALEELIPFIGLTAASLVLGGATPMVPDEAVPVAVAARRGRTVLGRIAALGREGILPVIQEMAGNSGNESINLMAENLRRLLEGINEQGYFTEVFVSFSAAENYFINNQLRVTTADGSIEIIFSITETTNSSELVDAIPVTDEAAILTLPDSSCDAAADSPFVVGTQVEAQTFITAVPVYWEDGSDPSLTLIAGEPAELLMPFCDEDEGELWWYLRNEFGETGWARERVDGFQRFSFAE